MKAKEREITLKKKKKAKMGARKTLRPSSPTS